MTCSSPAKPEPERRRWCARSSRAGVRAHDGVRRRRDDDAGCRRLRRIDSPTNANKPSRPARTTRGRGQRPPYGDRDRQRAACRTLFDELRTLANAAVLTQRPLEILLVGLPALEARLAEPAFDAVRQRVSAPRGDAVLAARDTSPAAGRARADDRGRGFLGICARSFTTRTGGVARAINALVGESMKHSTPRGIGGSASRPITSPPRRRIARRDPPRPWRRHGVQAAETAAHARAAAREANRFSVPRRGPRGRRHGRRERPREQRERDLSATTDGSDPRVSDSIRFSFIKPDQPRFRSLLMASPPSQTSAGIDALDGRGTRGRGRARPRAPPRRRAPQRGHDRPRRIAPSMPRLACMPIMTITHAHGRAVVVG